MRKREQSLLLGYSLLFIQPIFMASNLIVARGGVQFVPPISLAFMRWALVFLIILPFVYLKIKKNFKFVKKESKKLFFLGLMGCGVCGAFPFIAGLTTTITNMGIIYSTSPIFILIISSLFFSEKMNIYKFIGLILCLGGVLAIIIKGDINLLLSMKFTSGDLWMLGAAIGWALYSIYLLNWKSKLDTWTRFTLIAFFGALTLLPFSIYENIYMSKITFTPMMLFWVIFAALSPGIAAFILYGKVQSYLGASITGFTLYLFTVYGAIYGILLFGETLDFYHYYGAAFVFLGVYFVRKRLKKNV